MYKGGIIFSVIVSSFLLCVPVFAFDFDAGITAKDVFFDKDELIIGKPLRIYAVVKNFGAKDIEAYVTFYQGPSLIGQSQPISLRASGLAEEVFVDWTIPDGDFNILAKIQGQNPTDENAANDEAITNIFIPDIDTDNDGIGNRLDEDDDNDGISDAQERTQGLDPLRADSDGDGSMDGQDLYPLDSTKYKNDPPPQPKVTAQTVSQPKPVAVEPATPPADTPVEVVPVVEEVVIDPQPPIPAPVVQEEGIVVKTIQFSWKVFGFEVTPKANAQYTWQFPDGSIIKEAKTVKEFPGPGTYSVLLKETMNGVTKEVSTQVVVAYFHPANMMLWVWLGGFGVAGVLLTILFWFVIRKWKH